MKNLLKFCNLSELKLISFGPIKFYDLRFNVLVYFHSFLSFYFRYFTIHSLVNLLSLLFVPSLFLSVNYCVKFENINRKSVLNVKFELNNLRNINIIKKKNDKTSITNQNAYNYLTFYVSLALLSTLEWDIIKPGRKDMLTRTIMNNEKLKLRSRKIYMTKFRWS